MLSIFMVVLGLFFLAADNILIGFIGIGLIAGMAYREGAFYGMRKARKRKESCHRPK